MAKTAAAQRKSRWRLWLAGCLTLVAAVSFALMTAPPTAAEAIGHVRWPLIAGAALLVIAALRSRHRIRGLKTAAALGAVAVFTVGLAAQPDLSAPAELVSALDLPGDLTVNGACSTVLTTVGGTATALSGYGLKLRASGWHVTTGDGQITGVKDGTVLRVSHAGTDRVRICLSR